MTTRRPDTVAVYADLEHFDEPLPMGSLRCRTSRTGDIFSFEYNPAWLRKPAAFTLDPDLALVGGPQYPAPGRANFGIFLDSSPHRWGRVLMQRRENMLARREGRRARSLTEWDFLLGVHDETVSVRICAGAALLRQRNRAQAKGLLHKTVKTLSVNVE